MINRYFWVLICCLLIATGVVTAFYFRNEQMKKERLRQQEQLLSLNADVEGVTTGLPPKEETKDTPEEEKPTATPTPASSYALALLNGSGIAGEAGRVKKVLEDADIIVSSVGNAKRYNYVQTEIHYKSSVKKSLVDSVMKTLTETYAVSSASADLETTNDYDIEIIVGKEKD